MGWGGGGGEEPEDLEKERGGLYQIVLKDAKLKRYHFCVGGGRRSRAGEEGGGGM